MGKKKQKMKQAINKNLADKKGDKFGWRGISLQDFKDKILLRIITGYFLVSAWNLFSLDKIEINPVLNWKDYVGQLSFGWILVFTLLIAAIITLAAGFIPEKIRALEPVLSVASILTFDIKLMFAYIFPYNKGYIVSFQNVNYYLIIGVILVSLVFISYALSKFSGATIFSKIPNWVYISLISLVAVSVTIFICVATILRHYCLCTAVYDLGIFVQMFHSLADNFTAVTTCERDYLLSHFSVHSSYIFYLLVPIFKIFPYTETLLIIQALFVMGGVIPLVLIAKGRGFKWQGVTVISLIYTLSASLILPSFYEFHENALLPTLLMWTLWAVEKKKLVPFYIFSVLVCLVKEDAPLFILCIGLYMFFEYKGNIKRLHGLIAMIVSGVYMLVVTNWLTNHGDGQFMTSTRFNHLLLSPEGGLTEVISNSLSDPGYFFSLLVSESTLLFFIQVMLPLLFIPFITKKIHRFNLMIPFIITNLVIGAYYGYAANIAYQYIFGPATLLIYMTVVNMADMTPVARRNIPILVCAASMIFSFGCVPAKSSYISQYKQFNSMYVETMEALRSIPQDTVIGTNATLGAHLCDRKEVYVLDKSDINQSGTAITDAQKYDFAVLLVGNEITPTLESLLIKDGFVLWDEVEGKTRIYMNPQYQ